MTIHVMHLDPTPFEMIRDGRKTIELRLFDEKRRKIRIGDMILFESTGSAEILAAKVTEMLIFDSFAALYQRLPLLECGYTEETAAAAGPEDMTVYYSADDQKKYGVVGIRLAPDPVVIAEAHNEDVEGVAALAGKLWDHPAEELVKEFSELLERSDATAFAAKDGGAVIGFAQCQLRRDYVEGTSTSPVGYLEGVYVEEAFRHKAIAASLLRVCEEWAKKQGCTEFASDCELDNADSLRFHLAVGFAEANRIICFTKHLT